MISNVLKQSVNSLGLFLLVICICFSQSFKISHNVRKTNVFKIVYSEH